MLTGTTSKSGFGRSNNSNPPFFGEALQMCTHHIARADPTSLISISRRLDALKKETIILDKTIASLAEVVQAIQGL